MNKSKVTDSVSIFSRFLKPVIRYIWFSKNKKHCIFIMGCQRSGTTLISRVFDRIIYTKVFREFDKSINKEKNSIRLANRKKLLNTIQNSHANLIVLKPLVESQNAESLIDTVNDSHILWVYRHYLDVGLSDIKKFPENPGRSNLLPIINEEKNNWRNEHISVKTLEKIKSLYSAELSPLDCACLFWYTRNILFFEQHLDTNEKVYLWSYERFVQTPLKHFNSILVDLQFLPQKQDIVRDVFVHNNFTSQNINKDVKDLCETLLAKLNAILLSKL